MYLNLIVPSTKLEIYLINSETGDLINVNKNKEIGPFKEADLVNLTCASAGGNPSPKVGE